jgi:hypothetical protein
LRRCPQHDYDHRQVSRRFSDKKNMLPAVADPKHATNRPP